MISTGVVDGAGVEVTDKDEAIEGLSRTVITLFAALMASNALMKEMLPDHLDREHGGDQEAMCGMKTQIAINDSIQKSVFSIEQSSVH